MNEEVKKKLAAIREALRYQAQAQICSLSPKECAAILADVEAAAAALEPRSVFVASQPNSSPWGVFSTLEEAQECALRAYRATMHTDGNLTKWTKEELVKAEDPEVNQRDPLIARWVSEDVNHDEEDSKFVVDQLLLGQQGFAP